MHTFCRMRELRKYVVVRDNAKRTSNPFAVPLLCLGAGRPGPASMREDTAVAEGAYLVYRGGRSEFELASAQGTRLTLVECIAGLRFALYTQLRDFLQIPAP